MSAAWHRTVAGSVVRRVDLGTPWEPMEVARDGWQEGDVVVVEVAEPPHRDRTVERIDGRMADLTVGDRVVGALGTRCATLEAVGSWRDAGSDGRLHLLTAAGLLGRMTSVSPLLGSPVEVVYVGHATRHGHVLRLQDTLPPLPTAPFTTPVVLLIGTSMSSGKTTAARRVVHTLKRRGFRVVGAKLTGAGRYRDILAMQDAGADAVFDFVDAGLSSTAVDPTLYADRLDRLLGTIAAAEPDVVVAEAGASPLEPYNGDAVLRRVDEHVRCTILCASDPYAVVGVMQGFGRRADLVSGPATTTTAGAELIHRLTALPSWNALDPAATGSLEAALDRCGLAAPEIDLRGAPETARGTPSA